MNIDIDAIIESAAESHYKRHTYIPESYKAAFGLRQQQPWDRLPEGDKVFYRDAVRPVVLDTLRAVGYENFLKVVYPDADLR